MKKPSKIFLRVNYPPIDGTVIEPVDVDLAPFNIHASSRSDVLAVDIGAQLGAIMKVAARKVAEQVPFGDVEALVRSNALKNSGFSIVKV